MTAVVLVNTFEFITWKRDAVGEWRPGAVVLATLALLVVDSYSHLLRASGSVAILSLGLYDFVVGKTAIVKPRSLSLSPLGPRMPRPV